MKNINVAILVIKFPNLLQTYVLNQIIGLQRYGAELLIVAKQRGDDPDAPEYAQAYKLLSQIIYLNSNLRYFIKNIFLLPIFNKRFWLMLRKTLFSKSFSVFGFRYRINKLFCTLILAQKDIDIIHSHSFFTSFNYLFMREDFNIPIVTTYHGKTPPGVPRLSEKKIKEIFNVGDLFLVNTMETKNELVLMGCDASKIKIIPQATDVNFYPFKSRKINIQDKIILLSVGRLSAEKGHRVAMNALVKIKNEFPTVEYHIVGYGKEKQALIDQAEQLGVTANVKFHGFKSGEHLQRIYSESHIFILPSYSETQGTVLQEAQASGLPVVASNTGGIPEVVMDGQTGLLFSTGDSDDLCNKLRQLITKPEYFQKLCSAGRNDVEKRFDVSIITKRLISIYEGITHY